VKKPLLPVAAILALLLWCLPAAAAEIDVPFVLRLTATEGGTTASDAWWRAPIVITDAESGQETATNGIIHVMGHGGYVVLNRWVQAGADYILRVSDVFELTREHYIYVGTYSWDAGDAWAFDKGMKIPRVMDYTEGYPFRIDNDEEYFFFHLAEGGFTDDQNFSCIRYHEIRSGIGGQMTTIRRARVNGQAVSGEYMSYFEYDPVEAYTSIAIQTPDAGGTGFPAAVPAADEARIQNMIDATQWPTQTVDPVTRGNVVVIPLQGN